jgi:hypothetical protein
VESVDALVRAHEEGGWREADLLQAADSISFLETMIPLVSAWPPERAEGKVRHSVQRIKPELTRARELATPYYEAGLRSLAEAAA